MSLFASSAQGKPAPRPQQQADLSIADLAARLAVATPQDTCKGMFFNGVLSAANALVGSQAVAQVKALLPERKYIDFFNYPIATFLPAAFTAATLLQSPNVDFDQAMRLLGEQAIADFLSTPVGRTLLTVSSGEARRLLRSTPTAYKTAVSYGERETVFSSDTACVLKVRRDFMPYHYHVGVMHSVLVGIGTADVNVRGQRLGLLDADYHISWK